MAGIYIHIPFCKQACYYCDFHFSTSLKNKNELLKALVREIELRKDESLVEQIETIYFGGGTPSLLTIEELRLLIDTIYQNYNVVKNPEITLEANPDDLSTAQIHKLASTQINRLSIGIQSFFDEDLQLMNRAHNAEEAQNCLSVARDSFENISIDLIYGIPGLTNKRWLENVEKALSFNVPHISSYALTVEPKTALESLIKKGVIANVDDAIAQEQFLLLIDTSEAKGFIHYEISNFGKEGWFSKNNSAYWKGKSYIGIGPSAHSFNGKKRSWNVRNNNKYIKSINENILPSESETLTNNDCYNEYVMTGLRTIWGVSLAKIESDFGLAFKEYLLEQSRQYLDKQFLYIENDKLLVTKKGKFLSDGIAADLFKLNV